MNRRRYLVGILIGLLSGCQELVGGEGQESNRKKTSTVKLSIANESEKEDSFDISVVNTGDIVHTRSYTVQPGEQKIISQSWEGEWFVVYGLSNEFSNYEIHPIDKSDMIHEYRTEFVIQNSGDVGTRGFGQDR